MASKGEGAEVGKAEATLDLAHLRGWIGRSQTAGDEAGPGLAARFYATFDREGPLAPGAVAPRMIHLCLAPAIAPTAALGPDGHPARGGFLPPVALPRRMWAGGRIDFPGEVILGAPAVRRSTVQDVTLKQGRSGTLCFVTVEHQIESAGALAVVERQDLVFRGIGGGGGGAPEAAPVGAYRAEVIPSAALLFRYSALTFNGHRIHYDAPYATGPEAYPGLVVHGPLQATLLAQFAADIHGRPPVRFDFRSLTPLFDDAPVALNAEADGEGALRLWTARPGGPVAMEARAMW